MNGSTRILLVDDDVRLTTLIAETFTREGFEVSVCNHGGEAVERILREQPDLVVLDLMLPGEDGLTICRKVRDAFRGPVLMLSARGDEIDQVVGLEVGADDYVAKPASPRLLVARVRALLRRRASAEAVEADRRTVGPLVVDRSALAATVGSTTLTLTTAEFDLLWMLADKAGQPVGREDLLRHLRGIAYNGLDRSIDVRVSQLRRKLQDVPEAPQIKTVRGVGYQLVVG
jgi:two-component system, OmpR family, response regulator RstA